MNRRPSRAKLFPVGGNDYLGLAQLMADCFLTLATTAPSLSSIWTSIVSALKRSGEGASLGTETLSNSRPGPDLIVTSSEANQSAVAGWAES